MSYILYLFLRVIAILTFFFDSGIIAVEPWQQKDMGVHFDINPLVDT